MENIFDDNEEEQEYLGPDHEIDKAISFASDVVRDITNDRYGDFFYFFEESHIRDGHNKPILTRPTHCFVLMDGRTALMKVHYEFDTRFSKELSAIEAARIQKVIKDEALAVISSFGAVGLINANRKTKGRAYIRIIKESEEKSWMSLN